VLKRHPWPGNVRELKNVIERAVLFSRGNPITPESLRLPAPESRVPLVQPPDVSMDLVAQEQQMMLKALNRFRWNQSRAARELGITRSALRYRLQKYGMGSPSEIEV
jgi:DNA-binding NtrC family response regulator